ncbi:MAG TPA: uroporphyrinogen decarboxylase family protein [Verrucomicrobiae bacterium]|nr:uroporphyrinogen decarboxylase family protein [Verrucomicrobiae bacterium]
MRRGARAEEWNLSYPGFELAICSAPATVRPMTKRERVMAALRGEPVDRVPLAFWLHNFATENSAQGLADETLRLLHRFDWDFLKPQSRAQCFAEMWGLAFAPSGEKARPYSVTDTPVADAAGLAALRAVNPEQGALGEQLEALRLLRAAVGPDVPIIWTVFSPLMVLPMLVPGGREQALALARSSPRETESALGAMGDTFARYARACLAAGADGLFYATNMATRELISAEECRRWQRPFDLRVLEAVAEAPFNVLHVCGPGIHFDEFADYPVTAFSWATVPGNPSLDTVHVRTGKAVVGGLPAKPEIAAMKADELMRRARRAIAEMSGRWLLLGPDCSINPDTPEALMAIRP